MNSQKRHYLQVFVRVRVCEQRTVGMSGGVEGAVSRGRGTGSAFAVFTH